MQPVQSIGSCDRTTVGFLPAGRNGDQWFGSVRRFGPSVRSRFGPSGRPVIQPAKSGSVGRLQSSNSLLLRRRSAAASSSCYRIASERWTFQFGQGRAMRPSLRFFDAVARSLGVGSSVGRRAMQPRSVRSSGAHHSRFVLRVGYYLLRAEGV
jgi:hypothetical protein